MAQRAVKAGKPKPASRAFRKLPQGDKYSRYAALPRVLNRLGTKGGARLLARLLESKSEDPIIRHQSAVLLGQGKFQSSRSQRVLLQTALKDPDAKLRFFCISSLTKLKSKSAVPAFIKIMGSDPSESAASAAHKGITELGTIEQIKKAIKVTTKKSLEKSKRTRLNWYQLDLLLKRRLSRMKNPQH